jgi:hypothetical protein
MSKEELLDLLIENRFRDLFPVLKKEIADRQRSTLTDRLNLLEARYNELREDELRGNQAADKIQVRYNALREQLQEVIFDLYRPPTEPKPLLQRRRFWLPVALVLAALALLWWGLRPAAETRFELSARLTSISVRLLEDWDLEYDLYLQGWEAYPLSHLRTDTSDYQSEAYGPFGARLSSGRFQLSALPLAAGTRLNLRASGPDLILDIADHQVPGELEVDSARLDIDEAFVSQKLRNRQLIEFTTEPSATIAFTPAPRNAFRMDRLKIGVGWEYTTKDAEGRPVSTLQSGVLTASGITDTLFAKQLVEMDALQSGFLDIRQEKDVLQVTLRGRATGLRVGDPGELQSRQPTRIEKLLQNKQANLLWQGVMGLLSLVGAVLGVLQVGQSLAGRRTER